MEQTINLEKQNLDQIPPQNNIFKILFFIFLALFLIISIILAIFLVKNNKKQPELITKDEQTKTVFTATPTTVITPDETVKEEDNILKISDIQMELPNNWKVSSVSGNTAKILTDYSKYQVFLTLKLNKNDSIAESSYISAVSKIKTEYGEVFDVSQGGAKGVTGAVINGNKYSFEWNIESNQPVPTNLDGIWRPDDNVTSKILLDITKTVKPVVEVSNIPKDWKTYTNATYKYSISYPKDWEIDVKPNQFTILTLTSPEYIKNINNPQNYEGILGDQFEVSFYKNYKNTLTANKNLEEYLSDKNLFTQYVAQKINGLTFYKAEQMGMGVRTVYFNIKGENLFEFSFNSGVTKIDQQIINTLKFN